jgi:hypothetical protein
MDMKMLNGFAPFLGRTGKGRTRPKPFQTWKGFAFAVLFFCAADGEQRKAFKIRLLLRNSMVKSGNQMEWL